MQRQGIMHLGAGSRFLLSQFSSVAQSCPTLCNPMDCSTPGLPVHHQLLEFTQTHVHWVSDAIQPSQPLSSPSPPGIYITMLVSPQGPYITISLNFSEELRPSPRWWMATSRWAQDSWNTTLIHYQPIRRKSHNLQPSPQIFPIKHFSENHWRIWGFWTFLFIGTAINLSLLQTLMYWFTLPHCLSGIKTLFDNSDQNWDQNQMCKHLLMHLKQERRQQGATFKRMA